MLENRLLEPERIFSEIDAQPPLMREQARAAYVGKGVDWVLTFADGWQESSEFARLAFRQERSVVRFVKATVPLTDCPWLKHMHAGEIMRVRGRIAELDRLSITLRGASVSQFIQATHYPPPGPPITRAGAGGAS